MSWGPHINNITGKARRTLGFLRRNLNVNSKEVKENAYKALVRPTIEYGSTVWDPHQAELKHKIEMVQRQAARYVESRYRHTSSVGDMLKELRWESLEQRRLKARLVMLYKISFQLVAISPVEYLIPVVAVPEGKIA